MFEIKQTKTLILLTALVVTLLLAGVAMAGPSATTLDRWVMAGGGGVATPAGNSIEVTIGQMAVGKINSGKYDLCAGYWCNEDVDIYLPLIQK